MKTSVAAVFVSVISVGVGAQLPQFEMVSPFGDKGRNSGLLLDGVGGVATSNGTTLTRLRADGSTVEIDLSRGRGEFPLVAGVAGDYVLTISIGGSDPGLYTLLGPGFERPIEGLDPDEVIVEPKLNPSGVVVGTEYTDSGQIAWRWDETGRQQLSDESLLIEGITADGDVLVQSFGPTGVGYFTDDGFEPLAPRNGSRFDVGGRWKAAANGDAAATAFDDRNGQDSRGFVGYHVVNGETTELVAPEGTTGNATVFDVSSMGWVVGMVGQDAPPGSFADQQPTLWIDQQPYDLNDLVDDTFGLTIRDVFQVDDTGQIVVVAYGSTGGGTYLLRPIPSPGGVGLCAAIGLLAVRRRR